VVDRESAFYKYLSEGQRGLVEESLVLLDEAKENKERNLVDYAYIVFPMAKAYEGFLKQIFVDRGFISSHQYNSDHFRIGKALSPNLVYHLRGKSVYFLVKQKHNDFLADKMWQMWKRGRNVIFHYFPHNYQAIDLPTAEQLVYDFIRVMEEIYVECK